MKIIHFDSFEKNTNICSHCGRRDGQQSRPGKEGNPHDTEWTNLPRMRNPLCAWDNQQQVLFSMCPTGSLPQATGAQAPRLCQTKAGAGGSPQTTEGRPWWRIIISYCGIVWNRQKGNARIMTGTGAAFHRIAHALHMFPWRECVHGFWMRCFPRRINCFKLT